MSRVLVNGLNVRTAPSTSAQKVAHYDQGQIINSGDSLIENEGRTWLRYTGGSGNKRFVCAIDRDGTKYVDVHIQNKEKYDQQNQTSVTGIPGIPKQSQFPDARIRNWGCCFLCTCVKGGLTTRDQCIDCFNWGLKDGKLRSSDCYISCNKESWAREISQRYGTPYHGDYCYEKNSHHFWLTQNGREIFNSEGIGWR